jgi:hypothetical protein
VPKFYKVKDGDDTPNKMVIVPYKIKSKLHPLVHAGRRSVGDYVYNLDIYIHGKVGPGGTTTVICPSLSYGKACPICEAGKNWIPEKTDEQNPFKAKRRVYYNVVDMSDPDEGLKVFDVSHYYMEKELIGAASRKSTNGQIIRFADPDNSIGKIIKFYGEKEKKGGFESVKFKDFEFIERKINVAPFIEKAISFDELLVLHTYDELMAILNGTDEDEGESSPDFEPTENKVSEDELLEKKMKEKEASKTVDVKEVNRCPSGYKFGGEWMDHPECKKDTCPEFKACGMVG